MSDFEKETRTPDIPEEAASVKKEKKTKKKSSGKKSLFRSATRLYAALAIAALVATLGWFTSNTLVFIENETPGNIQISVNSGDLWIANSLSDFDTDDYDERAHLLEIDSPTTSTYIDISGNGETLYFPKTLEINANNEDVADLASADNFSDVTGNTEFYIELKVYFRTSAKMDVYLSKDSKISPKEGIINSGNVSSFARQSLYGTFSCDGIAGAARVAFLEADDYENPDSANLTLKSVWIPNDDYKLTYTDSERSKATFATGVAAANRESRTGYSYVYKYENTMSEYTYTADDYANGRVLVTGASDTATVLANPDTNMSNQATPLLTFDGGSVQTKLLVIRIWFEGTDNEADKALNGGAVSYNLNFFGISKEDCAVTLVEQEKINSQQSLPDNELGIYYNTALNQLCYYKEESDYNQSDAVTVANNYILYSIDGITWQAYTETTSANILNPKRSAGAYDLYIRIAETASAKPGNIVKITVPAS